LIKPEAGAVKQAQASGEGLEGATARFVAANVTIGKGMEAEE
jgi:hypothetical protein